MKYLIAHLIRGEAREGHINLTKELSNQLGFEDLSQIIPPHFTLKHFNEPLNEKELETLEKFLFNFSKSVKAFNYNFSGFGNFGNKVFFLKPSGEDLSNFSNFFLKELKKIKGIKLSDYDREEITFHATLAYLNGEKDLLQVQDYFSSNIPFYAAVFDNITRLRKAHYKWEIYKEFILK